VPGGIQADLAPRRARGSLHGRQSRHVLAGAASLGEQVVGGGCLSERRDLGDGDGDGDGDGEPARRAAPARLIVCLALELRELSTSLSRTPRTDLPYAVRPDVARGGPWSSQRLPGIISDLRGSQSSFTCVVVATLLTTTVSTPIWGKLADLADRKKLIQLALTITVLSSAAAGLSHNVETLITMRAFQGIGAGGLTALGTVLIAAIISPRERGKMMGLMGAVMGVAMIGGPLLGGVLTDRPGRQFSKSPARMSEVACTSHQSGTGPGRE